MISAFGANYRQRQNRLTNLAAAAIPPIDASKNHCGTLSELTARRDVPRLPLDNRPSGRPGTTVGNSAIGTTAPDVPSTAWKPVVGDKISLWGQSGTALGFASSNEPPPFMHDGGRWRYRLRLCPNAQPYGKHWRIKVNGNVGIAPTSYGPGLDVNGGVRSRLQPPCSFSAWSSPETLNA